MRFKWLTAGDRRRNKERTRRHRMSALMEWHPVFLWRPTRIESEILWLERVARSHRGSNEAKHPDWQYANITILLTKEYHPV